MRQPVFHYFFVSEMKALTCFMRMRLLLPVTL